MITERGAKRVYVTVVDAKTRKSKSTTVPDTTPSQLVRLLNRIRRGEVRIVDVDPKAAVAA